jgi:CRP-like cAMP-binding protein
MKANEYFNPHADALGCIGAFSGLTREQRQELTALCRCRRYAAEQEVFSHHADSHDIYFILSGSAQALIYSMAGKQIILNDLGPGDLFGELSAIDGQPRSAFIVTTSEAVICSMTAGDFRRVLRYYSCVSDAVLKSLCQLIRQLCGRVYEISTLPVKNRIHIELLRLALRHHANANSVELTPSPTHHAIANRIGTHREAVSRELALLKKDGIIDRHYSRLIISDLARLRDLVREGAGMMDFQLQAS